MEESKALQADVWQDQLDLVRQMCPETLTNKEFDVFLYTCKRYGFDPIMKELIPQKYYNNKDKKYYPVTFITTHAALLSIAHRSRMYGGMKSEYNPETKEAIAWVWRRDSEHPTEVTVLLSEYKDDKSSLWRTKKVTMIKKCAEAAALRRAFNIHDVYLAEEMEKEIQLAGEPATVIPDQAPQGAFQPKPKLAELPEKAESAPEPTKEAPKPEEPKNQEPPPENENITDEELKLIKEVRQIAGNLDTEVKNKIQTDMGLNDKLCSEMTMAELNSLRDRFILALEEQKGSAGSSESMVM